MHNVNPAKLKNKNTAEMQQNRRNSSTGIEIKRGLPLGVMVTEKGPYEGLAMFRFLICVLFAQGCSL